jgi:hypothetical protein
MTNVMTMLAVLTIYTVIMLILCCDDGNNNGVISPPSLLPYCLS